MSALWLVYVLSFSSGAVKITGDVSCPTAAEIEGRLAMLPGSETPSPHFIHLEKTADGIRFDILGDASQRLSTRTLPAETTCEDITSVIAVVLSSWQASLPSIEPPSLVLPRPPPSPRSRSLTSLLTAELGLSLGLSLSPAATPAYALSGGLEGSIGEPARGFGVLLSASATTLRALTFGDGSVSWHRFDLAVGPRYRLTSTVPHVELYAQALGALLRMSGNGFSKDIVATGIDLGVGGGVRVKPTHGTIAPFVKLEAKGWLRRQEVRVAGLDGLAVVPNIECVLAVGATWTAL